MPVKYFEDLEIWQLARNLTNEIYKATGNSRFAKDYGLVDQIRRASVSIMSNIAEGFERGGNQEFSQFLYIAKGSCGEVRAQLYVALDQEYIDREKFNELFRSFKKLSVMISNLIEHLKGSKFRGEKYKKPPIKSIKEELAAIEKELGLQR